MFAVASALLLDRPVTMRQQMRSVVMCWQMGLLAVPLSAGEGARSVELRVGVTVVRSCSVSTTDSVPASARTADRIQVACAKGVAAPRVVEVHAKDGAAADSRDRVGENRPESPSVVVINF